MAWAARSWLTPPPRIRAWGGNYFGLGPKLQRKEMTAAEGKQTTHTSVGVWAKLKLCILSPFNTPISCLGCLWPTTRTFTKAVSVYVYAVVRLLIEGATTLEGWEFPLYLRWTSLTTTPTLGCSPSHALRQISTMLCAAIHPWLLQATMRRAQGRHDMHDELYGPVDHKTAGSLFRPINPINQILPSHNLINQGLRISNSEVFHY